MSFLQLLMNLRKKEGKQQVITQHKKTTHWVYEPRTGDAY